MANETTGLEQSISGEIDTLSPEYQKLLDELMAKATTGDPQGFSSTLKSAPAKFRQQLVDDAEFSVRGRIAYIINAAAGYLAVQRLSRRNKEEVVRDIANAVDKNVIGRFIESVDPALHINPAVVLKDWQDYAKATVAAIDVVKTLRIDPEYKECLAFVQKFRTMNRGDVGTLRSELLKALQEVAAGKPVTKPIVEKISVVLTKAGYSKQTIGELAQVSNYNRLLAAANKVYSALTVVEQHYNDQAGQESALKQRLIALRDRVIRP